MKALIYGAGRMGKAAGYDLAKRGFDVTYADVKRNQADICVNGVSDSCLFHLFKEHDIVLGCANYNENERLTKLCIEAKTHFCDLGGNNHIVKNQMSYDYLAKKNNIMVIPDCGLAPGMSNLLAAAAIDELGGRIDNVKIRVGGLPINPIPPLNYMITWSVNGLINEYLEPCEVLRNGEITHVEPLTEVESLIFQNNIYEAFHTSGGLSTLAKNYSGLVENMDYKTIRYPGHAQAFAAMKSLQLFKDRVIFNGEEFHPRDMLEKLIQENVPNTGYDKVFVRVEVEKGSKIIIYEIIDYQDSKFSAMARMTGFSIATVAELLANGEVIGAGVVPGELYIPLNKYIECIKARGIDVKKLRKVKHSGHIVNSSR